MSQLIDQRTKRIMEECKLRAADHGLSVDTSTLEYIITNRDMIELGPKGMIPTLYDYWVHDVEVHKGQGQYQLYPSNPYETVINTRPAISFYNDNNPDWLNIMIFYHVLGHIDFFQNNVFFSHTWHEDFTAEALAGKKQIAKLRSEHGRWVDYAIEFAKTIDNLVNYHRLVADIGRIDQHKTRQELKVDFYFNRFLQKHIKLNIIDFEKKRVLYNEYREKHPKIGIRLFFDEVMRVYPEFEKLFEEWLETRDDQPTDLMQFIMKHSTFLNKKENEWWKIVMEIIRDTSLYFAPQIRTKIMNEGWASYWHDYLFRSDPRINGHETNYAIVNSRVTSLPRLGTNPYAVGMRLFEHIREMADRGCYSREYEKLTDREARDAFDMKTGGGLDRIFKVRESIDDAYFLQRYIDQEFTDRYKLFVHGQRMNPMTGKIEYYIKSKSAELYKKLMLDNLYSPPHIKYSTDGSILKLKHVFEGRVLVQPFIENTLKAIQYLWGDQVTLETYEFAVEKEQRDPKATWLTGQLGGLEKKKRPELIWQKMLYTCSNKREVNKTQTSQTKNPHKDSKSK